MKDGFQNKCISCTLALDAERKEKNAGRHSLLQRERYKKRVSEGKCCCCDVERMSTSNCFCEVHYLKELSYRYLKTRLNDQLLLDKLKAQNYKCVYTGETLILGLNDSIDHIKPASKYPELKSDINNLQWVLRDVNFMKQSLSEDRFLELVEMIYIKNCKLKSNLNFNAET